MILLDASAAFAYLNERDPAQSAIKRVIEADAGPLAISPFVLAELDYLIGTRIGVQAELALLRDVCAGAYWLAPFTHDDLAKATEVIERYANLGIGLADASIVVLAGQLGTNRVLTLDERHFRTLRAPRGEPFVVLPADA